MGVGVASISSLGEVGASEGLPITYEARRGDELIRDRVVLESKASRSGMHCMHGIIPSPVA
jgi:hypothetical protein